MISTKHNNLLLISNTLRSSDVFISSVNENTLPLIFYNNEELISQLNNNFNTIERIAIVFEKESNFIFGDKIQFFIKIIKDYSVKNIDFLACNTLDDRSYTNIYETLYEETGVIVGASNDKTGNIKYGGNWVMENTSEDIEKIYFNSSIAYYKYLLGSGDFLMILESSLTNSKLYFNGSNDYSQLGIIIKNPIPTIQSCNININNNTYYKKISTGTRHSLLLSNNILYGSGDNSYNQMGSGISIYNEFTMLPIKLIADILNIYCGDKYSIILCNDGSVYITGTICDGIAYSNFTKLQFANEKIVDVGAGFDHVLLLTDNNNVYITGDMTKHTIIANSTVNTNFKKLACPSGKIVNVFSGNQFSILLMKDYNLWTCGMNNYGQLGINSTVLSTVFKNVIMPYNDDNTIMKPSIVSCGNDCFSFYTYNGLLFGVGNNATGKFGKYSILSIPTIVKTPKNEIIRQIFCSNGYIITQITTKKINIVNGKRNITFYKVFNYNYGRLNPIYKKQNIDKTYSDAIISSYTQNSSNKFLMVFEIKNNKRQNLTYNPSNINIFDTNVNETNPTINKGYELVFLDLQKVETAVDVISSINETVIQNVSINMNILLNEVGNISLQNNEQLSPTINFDIKNIYYFEASYSLNINEVITVISPTPVDYKFSSDILKYDSSTNMLTVNNSGECILTATSEALGKYLVNSNTVVVKVHKITIPKSIYVITNSLGSNLLINIATTNYPLSKLYIKKNIKSSKPNDELTDIIVKKTDEAADSTGNSTGLFTFTNYEKYKFNISFKTHYSNDYYINIINITESDISNRRYISPFITVDVKNIYYFDYSYTYKISELIKVTPSSSNITYQFDSNILSVNGEYLRVNNSGVCNLTVSNGTHSYKTIVNVYKIEINLPKLVSLNDTVNLNNYVTSNNINKDVEGLILNFSLYNEKGSDQRENLINSNYTFITRDSPNNSNNNKIIIRAMYKINTDSILGQMKPIFEIIAV